MDKVKFNPFSEILVEDFLRQGEYINEAFNLLVADFLNQNTAVLGLEVVAQSVADMTVYVKPGRIYQSGQQGQLTVNLDPALTITAAHPDYMRIDRICAQYREVADIPETRNVMVDTVSRQVIQKTVMTRLAGSIDFMVVSGVAAPGPATPTVPEGWLSLAKVKVRAGTTSILATDILDERPTLKSLINHGHSGGGDGSQISYNSLQDRPNLDNLDYNFWKPNKLHALGNICFSPNSPSWTYMECTQTGTSGAIEPNWGTIAGAEITDNTAKWKVRDLRVSDVAFDNSNKIATTKFVQRALGNVQNVLTTNTSLALTAADAGKLINVYDPNPVTVTLPQGSTLPIGAKFYFFTSNISNQTVVTRYGTDTIRAYSGEINSFTLRDGDTLELVWLGNVWVATGGSAQIIAASTIVASGPGYTKYSDGTLIQCFGSGAFAGGEIKKVAFPIPFISTNNTWSFGYYLDANKTNVAMFGLDSTGGNDANGITIKNLSSNTSSCKITVIGRWK